MLKMLKKLHHRVEWLMDTAPLRRKLRRFKDESRLLYVEVSTLTNEARTLLKRRLLKQTRRNTINERIEKLETTLRNMKDA